MSHKGTRASNAVTLIRNRASIRCDTMLRQCPSSPPGKRLRVHRNLKRLIKSTSPPSTTFKFELGTLRSNCTTSHASKGHVWPYSAQVRGMKSYICKQCQHRGLLTCQESNEWTLTLVPILTDRWVLYGPGQAALW